MTRPLAALAVALVALAACSTSTPARPAASPPRPTPSATTTALASSPSGRPSARPTPVPRPSRRPVPPPTRSAAATHPPAPPAARYVFPISPAGDAHFAHAHHDYPATDIFAPCGDTYRAPAGGRVQSVSTADIWSPSVNAGATRGGLSVTLVGDDGVRYYGSHLRAIAPSVSPGARVVAGQPLGTVGNTGDARGIACHVHFGLSPVCGVSDWYNRRGLVYPWPFLESWRAGGQLSPVAAVAAYHSRSGCPAGPTIDP